MFLLFEVSLYRAKSAHARQSSPESGHGLKHFLGGVPREQKMLKGHLPRVIYRQVHQGHLPRVIYHQVHQYATVKVHAATFAYPPGTAAGRLVSCLLLLPPPLYFINCLRSPLHYEVLGVSDENPVGRDP